jgi:phenylalanyl-tRNA synthetase beta chain
MELSTRWIGDYVELPPSVEELAERLTAAGHAVELIEARGDDHVFDMDITTNRVDCMNHLGMAREVAVLFNRPLKAPQVRLSEAAAKAADQVGIFIDAPELCHRYVGRVIRGATIGPSPEWLRTRLEAIGLRPINNIVDVTNYVLWELGQPLHAFDLQKLGEATIRVRTAKAGETLTTLDGEERKLTEEMLVIADGSNPVALAGVMGGLDSEVTDSTRDILLESAYFDPASVRRTARALGMHTDASHRFERGADPEICAYAAERAAALMVEVAGGEILTGVLDVYPTRRNPRVVPLDTDRLRAFAGAEIPDEAIERWLRGLGCGIEAPQNGAWSVTVPSWRYLDLELTEDLYEEAIRLYGFDNIRSTLPALEGADGQTTEGHRLGLKIRQYLAASGYLETINFAFHDAESDAAYPGLYGERKALELANPLSERYAVMRRSLLPNLLESARFNQRRGAEVVRLFELGHVFADGEEMETVAVVAGGSLGTPWTGQHDLDFFDLKGLLEGLSTELGAPLAFAPRTLPGLLPGATAALLSPEDGESLLGYCGQLLDDEGFPLFVAEVRTDHFLGRESSLQVEVPSRYPGVRADLTLTHAVTVPWAEIAAAIREHPPQDLVAFELKDRYRGKGVPEGAVNTTLTFRYASPEGALTQEIVNERQGVLTEELKRRFGWEAQN